MSWEKPTAKEYKKIWGSHIDDLNRLKWHLDNEDREKIDKSQVELKQLVDKAWEGKTKRDKR